MLRHVYSWLSVQRVSCNWNRQWVTEFTQSIMLSECLFCRNRSVQFTAEQCGRGKGNCFGSPSIHFLLTGGEYLSCHVCTFLHGKSSNPAVWGCAGSSWSGLREMCGIGVVGLGSAATCRGGIAQGSCWESHGSSRAFSNTERMGRWVEDRKEGLSGLSCNLFRHCKIWCFHWRESSMETWPWISSLSSPQTGLSSHQILPICFHFSFNQCANKAFGRYAKISNFLWISGLGKTTTRSQ